MVLNKALIGFLECTYNKNCQTPDFVNDFSAGGRKLAEVINDPVLQIAEGSLRLHMEKLMDLDVK